MVVMANDAVVVDTLREVRALEERERQVAVAMAMCAAMQQQQMVMAALAAKGVMAPLNKS
jgi:hypothetical protein